MDGRILLVPEFLFDEAFGCQRHGELSGRDQAHVAAGNGISQLQLEELSPVQIGLGETWVT